MQKAPLQDKPLVGDNWTQPWHKWFDSFKSLAQSFLGLTDTPDSYIGQAGKFVRVKSDESSLEFVTGNSAVVDHNDVLNKGTNTHAQIDTAISNSVSHIADSSIHFTKGSISHTEISGIGSNTHAQIDSAISASAGHIANTNNPHSTTILKLTDTPSSYTGQAGKSLVVNATEDGVEFQTITGGGGGFSYFPSGW